jgi:hypothetical protein
MVDDSIASQAFDFSVLQRLVVAENIIQTIGNGTLSLVSGQVQAPYHAVLTKYRGSALVKQVHFGKTAEYVFGDELVKAVQNV